MAAEGGAREGRARISQPPAPAPSPRDADPGPSYWSLLVANPDWATWGQGGTCRPIAARGLAGGGALPGAVK